MHDDDTLMGTEDSFTRDIVYHLSYSLEEAMDLPIIIQEYDNFLVIDLDNIRGWLTHDHNNKPSLVWTVLVKNGVEEKWEPFIFN